MNVSVVVPTCNRADLLQRVLRSLVSQKIPQNINYEIVVVDDGSSDHTASALAVFSREVLACPVKVVRTTGLGVAGARNAGIENATGEWIAFFDDDQLASESWLANLCKVAVDKGALCVSGDLRLALPANNTPSLGRKARMILGEYHYSTDVVPYRPGDVPHSGNILFARELYFRVGGFDLRFNEGGEDVDFFSRVQLAGVTIWHAPAATGHHIIPESRLNPAYVQWVCRRIGAASARLTIKRDGRHKALTKAAVRIAVAFLRDLPLTVLARLRRSPEQLLDANCGLWYTTAYLRTVPVLLLSDKGVQSTFLKQLDFRQHGGERQ